MSHCETASSSPCLRARDRLLSLDRPLIMGVLNVTPDSFSDGGVYLDATAAIERALQMVEEGADLIDIGGESSRPGAEPIDEQEEQRRVLPVVEAVCERISVPVSVDTTKASVARRALSAGASMINDISALRFDSRMAAVVADSGAAVVLMHMQGTPKTMQAAPYYDDVVHDVQTFFKERLQAARAAGISEERIVLDPGIGFGKRPEDNLVLLGHVETFTELGRPILVGVSRKGFIGQILDQPLDQRLMGTAAACATAILRGARLIRVHDVRPMRDLVLMLDAIMTGRYT
jgi:dihydropteroate synthase